MTAQTIKVITDSVADVPDTLIKQWDIRVVPVYVNYNDRSYADDGIEVNREQFIRTMLNINPPPTTAAMPPMVVQAFFERALQEADHIIAVTTPAKLSGVYNAFRLAAEATDPKRITLIDSGSLSMGIGLQAVVAAEAAAQTRSVKETIEAVQQAHKNTILYAGLATLEQLRRSGRVSWALANIGALLQIKPVVRVDEGVVDAVDRVRTFRRMVDRMAEFAHKHAPYERVALLHLNNPEGVEALRQAVPDILPENTLIASAGTALCTHIGPGAIGFAGIRKT